MHCSCFSTSIQLNYKPQTVNKDLLLTYIYLFIRYLYQCMRLQDTLSLNKGFSTNKTFSGFSAHNFWESEKQKDWKRFAIRLLGHPNIFLKYLNLKAFSCSRLIKSELRFLFSFDFLGIKKSPALFKKLSRAQFQTGYLWTACSSIYRQSIGADTSVWCT